MRIVRYGLLALAAFLVYMGIARVPPFDNWSMNSLFLAVIALTVLVSHVPVHRAGWHRHPGCLVGEHTEGVGIYRIANVPAGLLVGLHLC